MNYVFLLHTFSQIFLLKQILKKYMNHSIYDGFSTEVKVNRNGVQVIKILKENDTYRIILEDPTHCIIQSLKTSAPLLSVAKHLQRSRKLNPGYFAMHAAALYREGQTYVFLGKTNTGKTTFVMSLIANGYQYITDDCVVVDLDTRKIVPYYQPLKLRKGGIDVLIENDIHIPELRHVFDSIIDRYIYYPLNSIKEMLDVTDIFQLERIEDGFSHNTLGYIDSFQCLIKSGLVQQSVSQGWLTCASFFAKKRIVEIKFSNLAELINDFK